MFENDPRFDGDDHINVYSKGKTELGRLLSNFTRVDAGINTPDGAFFSIEGYWYWLLSPSCRERQNLRYLDGYEAKKYGRSLYAVDWPQRNRETFEKKILLAIWDKVHKVPGLRDMLKESSLPFTHYYVTTYGTVITPKKGEWIIEGITRMRNKCQNT